MIKQTGVFASEQEVARAKQLSAEFSTTPLIKVLGRWLPDDARAALMDYIDACAVSHGLPAPGRDADGDVDHYGLLATGEFTREVPG